MRDGILIDPAAWQALRSRSGAAVGLERAEGARANGALERRAHCRVQLGDALDRLAQAALRSHACTLRGRPGPARTASQPHRARELPAQRLELGARPLGMKRVPPLLGVLDALRELLDALAVGALRRLVEQLARVAALLDLIGRVARDELERVDLLARVLEQAGEHADAAPVFEHQRL